MRIEAREVTAGYGAVDVLQQISFALDVGEFVGLIGPNGCGKSTLLRVLSRILRPRLGNVTLEGRTLTDWSALEIARRVAVVPQQEPATFDFLVRDVVLMGRYPHRMRFRGETEADYAVVRQALEDADVLALEDRPITRLSGGEYRRVLLARALAQQTPLLLLDEPTAHLDVTHQVELLTLTRRLVRERGVGALAALHELNQAAEFCDRLVLLCGGKMVDQGAPEHVLTPENLRIAYGAHARIGRNPVTGRPMILALTSTRGESFQPDAPPVHVVCGGGSGAAVFTALLRAGYTVTAGVLNERDSDQEAAEALGIAIVSESPFSPIGARARAACAALMASAQTIVVTAVPFGFGNLANLELAQEAQERGKSIVLIDAGDPAKRDYTEGAATALFARLAKQGAVRVATIEEWIEGKREEGRGKR